MITPETREEIRHIQTELKQPFSAADHQFRELPGTNKKWVFLPWQVVRERLDDVCPDWMPDYSEIQYLGNDAICRCGITILGVRKEAIASVPISILSSKGNEMTRGSAADRLAAESLKNASETWGVGRYLDDQVFTINYLWKHISELPEDKQGEVVRLAEQYKVQIGARPARQPKPKESGFLGAVAGTVQTITESQQKRLWAIAKNELKLTDEQIKGVYRTIGFEHSKEILVTDYEQVIEALRQIAKPPVATSDLYPANNNVIKQIRALTKHDPNWIFAQCKVYECDRPGAMPPDKLQKLVSDMLVDFAVTSGSIPKREQAISSVEAMLKVAIASGQKLEDAAMIWLERYRIESKV